MSLQEECRAEARRNVPGALLAARQARYWTQYDLSRATGIQQTAISAYENGERLPATPALFALARALEMDIRLLVKDRTSDA